jgi:hypothetical protein
MAGSSLVRPRLLVTALSSLILIAGQQQSRLQRTFTTSAAVGVLKVDRLVMSFDYTNQTDLNETTYDLVNETSIQEEDVSPLRQYDWLNPIWNTSFTLTVIVGTLGNLIVLWIVLCK